MALLHRVSTSFSAKFNGAVISFRRYFTRGRRNPTSGNANLKFIVICLFSSLQIISQDNSPLQTHPKTWILAITMLLMYGLAHDAQQRFSSSHPSVGNAARRGMALFGSLLRASLASLLFPRWVWVHPILYLVYILFYAGELIDWLHTRFIGELEEMDNSPV